MGNRLAGAANGLAGLEGELSLEVAEVTEETKFDNGGTALTKTNGELAIRALNPA